MDVHCSTDHHIDNLFRDFAEGGRNGPMNFLEICKQICLEDNSKKNKKIGSRNKYSDDED